MNDKCETCGRETPPKTDDAPSGMVKIWGPPVMILVIFVAFWAGLTDPAPAVDGGWVFKEDPKFIEWVYTMATLLIGALLQPLIKAFGATTTKFPTMKKDR